MFWIYSSNPPPLVLLLVQGQIFSPYILSFLFTPSHPSLVLYKYPSILYPLNSLHIPYILPYSLRKPSHSSLILYTYPPSLPIFDSTHILPSFPYSLHKPSYSSLILYTYPPILPLFSTHIFLFFPSLHTSSHPFLPLFSTHTLLFYIP